MPDDRINVELDIHINFEEVVDVFAKKHKHSQILLS